MPRIQVPIPVDNEPEAVVDPVVSNPEVTNEAVTSKPRKPIMSSQRWLALGVGLVFLILLVLVINLSQDRNKLKTEVSKLSSSSTSTNNTGAEVKRLTAEINKFYQLPTGETPTLATVNDATKVRSQAFFKDAKNGDKVLIYTKAGQAILYRPSTNKIIALAPLNLDNTSPTTTTPSTP